MATITKSIWLLFVLIFQNEETNIFQTVNLFPPKFLKKKVGWPTMRDFGGIIVQHPGFPFRFWRIVCESQIFLSRKHHFLFYLFSLSVKNCSCHTQNPDVSFPSTLLSHTKYVCRTKLKTEIQIFYSCSCTTLAEQTTRFCVSNRWNLKMKLASPKLSRWPNFLTRPKAPSRTDMHGTRCSCSLSGI